MRQLYAHNNIIFLILVFRSPVQGTCIWIWIQKMGPKWLSVYLTISFYQITSISWNITSFTEDGEYGVFRRPSKTLIWRRCCSKSFPLLWGRIVPFGWWNSMLASKLLRNIWWGWAVFEYCLVSSRICTSTIPRTRNRWNTTPFVPTMSVQRCSIWYSIGRDEFGLQ